jgi:hypothetical protein
MSQPRGMSSGARGAYVRSLSKASRGAGTIASCGIELTRSEHSLYRARTHPHALPLPLDCFDRIPAFTREQAKNRGFHTFGNRFRTFSQGRTRISCRDTRSVSAG